jgi:DNA processing protein
MHQEEKIFLHALRSLPHLGDKSLRKILEVYSSPKDAWYATSVSTELNLGNKITESFCNRHNFIKDPTTLFQELILSGVNIITEEESSYPTLLKEIPDRPYFLYSRGTYSFPTSAPLLAVVGSRKISGYGRQAVEKIVAPLARAGITIVSGLAFGVDKTAHEATLRAGGHTIAVLGSGIDDSGITPTSHQKLGLDIVKNNGLLLSEFPPGTIPGPGNFPLRNRVIAGMTVGTLVIEAADKSGSLITAKLALDYNRDVFAVPGSIFSPLSQGTHTLLKMGAFPVTHSQDILDVLLPRRQSTEASVSFTPPLPPHEQKIFSLLSSENMHINDLVIQSKLSTAEVTSTVLLLELKGKIKHIGNQVYICL